MRRFRRVGTAAFILVYLVILAGGIVRMSGAGMGCPDWPKCFGEWVPPTSVSQLPADYQQRFDVYGHGVEQFNATKTWTEYLNRLLGVLLGIAVFAFAVLGVSLLRKPGGRKLGTLAIASFLLTAFQGWLGSRVVATNLAHYMVTVHMVVALLIAALILWALLSSRTQYQAPKPMTQLGWWRAGALGLLAVGVVQIALGTQLREAIDMVSQNLSAEGRADWVTQAGLAFYLHRSFSWLVLAGSLAFAFLAHKQFGAEHRLTKLANLQAVAVVLEAGVGISLAYFALPAFLQPIHLVVASLVVGVWVYFAGLLFLAYRRSETPSLSSTSQRVKSLG